MEALAHAPKKELVNIKGISEAKVEKLQKEGELRSRRRMQRPCRAGCLLR